jgi:hypothetical protein
MNNFSGGLYKAHEKNKLVILLVFLPIFVVIKSLTYSQYARDLMAKQRAKIFDFVRIAYSAEV